MEGWKYVSMETGGQCAMTVGPQWIQMWLVDSLATLAQVAKEEKSFFFFNIHILAYSYTQIQLLIPVHTLGKTVLSS